jgi:hypothetical protein
VDAREEGHHPHDIMCTFVYRVPEKGVMQPRDYVELFCARIADAVVSAVLFGITRTYPLRLVSSNTTRMGFNFVPRSRNMRSAQY